MKLNQMDLPLDRKYHHQSTQPKKLYSLLMLKERRRKIDYNILKVMEILKQVNKKIEIIIGILIRMNTGSVRKKKEIKIK